MNVTVKILGLTLDELSDIISTTFYGNEYMAIDYEGNPSTFHDCFEDKVAQVLLDGGTILVTDQATTIIDDDQAQLNDGTYGDLPKYVDNDGYVTYKVTLEDILKGASSFECLEMIQSLLNGEGDMYTGWNLFQMIIFGDIVYS